MISLRIFGGFKSSGRIACIQDRSVRISIYISHCQNVGWIVKESRQRCFAYLHTRQPIQLLRACVFAAIYYALWIYGNMKIPNETCMSRSTPNMSIAQPKQTAFVLVQRKFFFFLFFLSPCRSLNQNGATIFIVAL